MSRVVHIVVLLLLSAYASATHIVGGEFEILHLEGDRYLFRQIQYFDVINGNPEAKDQVINASIFRKRDNVFVTSVVMTYRSENLVPYTNPQCTYDRLVTNRIVYMTEKTLDPELFSDPEGYYMVWERCCRNNIITNIIRPDETGQTFYIEFPPIRKNGQAFRNSSPQLFPPLSDYACANRFYYVDFRGFDPDGDSLVYSLATPINSSEYEPLPIPTPAPHPTVNWISGISAEYQIPGDPTLQINQSGFLTVTPSEEGLFVFSVKCEEFRDGIKIGEVVRDFQLFVIDCPDPGNPPEILVKAPKSDVFTTELDTIILSVDDEKCFDFKISDKDGSETITLKAEPVNFEDSVQNILSAQIGFINSPEDTMEIQVCLPDCPYLLDEPYIIDIIAQDYTCPLPLMDTMRLIVLVEPPPNKPPRFSNPVNDNIALTYVEGSVINLPFSAVDEDLDSLLLEVVGDDFDLLEFGLEVDTLVFEDGKIDFNLSWNTDCSVYPFADKNEFEIKLYVDDADQCWIDNRDSITLNIKIELPANNAPLVLLENESIDQEYVYRVGDEVLLDVRAFDGDPNDLLTLEAIGTNFDLTDVGIQFENQEGNSNIRADLSWNVDCNDFNAVPEGRYDILFIAEDEDKCKVQNADTVVLKLNILPPLNRPPEILINSETIGDTINVDAGSMIDLEILAFDLDKDSIDVRMLNSQLLDEIGASFSASSSKNDIYTNFTWQTDCSSLGDDFSDGIYNFSIVVNDHKCIVPKADTLNFSIVIEDEAIDYEFLPPNVFTPNESDEINDSFFVPDLPGDNCRRQFQEVAIFNRYGKKIFNSNRHDFEWYGTDQPSGVYYYIISYTDFSVRGTVSILR
jgi:gliding motility-associated-like protein